VRTGSRVVELGGSMCRWLSLLGIGVGDTRPAKKAAERFRL
jgi:hypothetical protein